MTHSEFIAWQTSSLQYYIRLTKDSKLEQVRVTYRTMVDELAILRQISQQHTRPETMHPITRIWWQWVQDVLPSYQNNPRLFEAENNAVRQAASQQRDAALKALAGEAAA